MKNIVLIGMPGAGKSTVGIVLAKKMGYAFIDPDLIIQEQEGMLLHEILQQKGLEYFKQTENRVNASIQAKRSVIATGGSVIYGAEAMEHLKINGTAVYLKLSLNELKKRIGNLKERGVAMQHGQTLENIFAERTPLYEKYADISIDCKNKKIREIVEETANLFQSVS